jgi:hypothetical protein
MKTPRVIIEVFPSSFLIRLLLLDGKYCNGDLCYRILVLVKQLFYCKLFFLKDTHCLSHPLVRQWRIWGSLLKVTFLLISRNKDGAIKQKTFLHVERRDHTKALTNFLGGVSRCSK